MNNYIFLDILNYKYINKFSSFLITTALIFFSVRGWFVLNTNIPAQYVYYFASLIITIFSIIGIRTRILFKIPDLIILRNMMLINLLLGIVNVFIDIIIWQQFFLTVVFIFILPYIIFLFFRIHTSLFYFSFIIIALFIAYSVTYEFSIALTGNEALQIIIDNNTKLRPDLYEGALSTTNNYIRVGGYTGSYHDSAHILGMLSAFFYVRFLTKKYILDILFFIITIIPMTFTQSATNIIVVLFTCLLFTIYIAITEKNIKIFIILLILFVLISVVVINNPETTIFAARAGKDGDWSGMSRALTFDMLLSPLFYLGHSTALASEFIITEVAHLKYILDLGLFHAILLYSILIYPIFLFFKFKSKCNEALPYLASVFFGFFSLLHYASLFRSTSIGLFYAFYSIALLIIIKHKYSLVKISPTLLNV